MAELCIIIHPTKYEEGDIILAMNDERIKSVHAQHICDVRKTGFNQDKLRIPDTLPDILRQKTYEFKFERISENEIKRIDLATMEYVIFSNVPVEIDGHKQAIDVPLFIEKRKKSLNHAIFGQKNREYWYGGKTSWAKISEVWQEIEARTIHREADHAKWLWTSGEKKQYLAISVDDFTNEERGELESPINKIVMVEGNPEVQIDKPRKYKVDWRGLGFTAKQLTDIQDITKEMDLRDSFNFLKSNIIQSKI